MHKLHLTTMLILAPCCALVMSAQSTTSSLTGTVTDSSGAIVGNAAITLKNTATGITYPTKTDSQGIYRVSQLPPGPYTMTVTSSGFQTLTTQPFTLFVDQAARQNVSLAVGANTESVTVSAGSLLLDTVTSGEGQVIENKQIESLPLNGRNYLQLAQLSAGVTPIVSGMSSPASTWTGTQTVSLAIAGLREDDVSYLYDGIETRNSWYGAVGLLPSIDNIQEFKVEQTGSSAAYGDGGAFVNVVTQSGTNTFHGTAYEFLRNNDFDARNYFDVGAPPPFHQNQFGASVGGPILKNKMFFFLNYEGFRQIQPNDSYNNVPTLAQRAGDFSADAKQLVNPFTGAAYPGNIITGPFSAIGQKMLSYYPLPNGTYPGGQNFFIVTDTTDNWNQESGRIDYSISTADSVFARLTWQTQLTSDGGITVYNGVTYPSNPKNVASGWTHIFSPHLVNNFRFGWNYSQTGDTRAFGFDASAANLLGLQNAGDTPGSYGLISYGVAGYANPGSPTGTEVIRENLFMGTDSLLFQKNKQAITVGLDIRYDPIYMYEDWQGTNLSFNGNYTNDPIADLLVGVPVTGATALGDPTLNFRKWYQAYYVQDNVQVSHNLNVNAGIRYEYSQPPVDTQNHVGSFDFATGTDLTYPATKVLGLGRQMVHPEYTNVSPRLGFNWVPYGGGQTVVKGGFGLYYLEANMNQYETEVDTPEYYSVQSYNNSPAPACRTAPCPTPPPLNFTADQLFNPSLPGAGSSVSFEYANNRTPYTYEWSLAVQQTFLKNWLFELTYLGSAAHHYEERPTINPLRPDGTTQYPNYTGAVSESLNEGSSIYNGLSARVEKRYSSGFSLLGAYTFSKCLDDPWQDQFAWHPLDMRLDRGHCTYDMNQHLSVNTVYELPFGHGKMFLNRGGVLNAAAGGWQLSAIVTAYTGPWLTLGSNQNLGNFVNALPNVSGPVNDASLHSGLGQHGRVGPYFDKQNVHAVTGEGIQGNASVGDISSPGSQDWDISGFKSWNVKERYGLTFRTDFFNIFNHANFTGLDTGVNDAAFANVTTAQPAREIQFSLRVNY